MISDITVSVIIPAYNAAEFIDRAIQSALAQTYQPVEILVIDDGSTDKTREVVARYGSPVRLLTQPNGGPASARNHGAREARGEWLALLDADDTWLPHKLERQVPYTQDNKVGIVCCFCNKAFRRSDFQGEISFERLWSGNCIDNSSVLLRRAVFEAVGGFNEDRDLISVEDYNLWLRISAASWKITTCPEVLWNYTPASGSLTRQVERFAKAELANVNALACSLNLNAYRVTQKRRQIYEQYGRELLYYRQMTAARRFLFASLRSHPSPRMLGWWLAAFLPVWLLNVRRESVPG